ncbi:probable plastidic glucose transporter 2 isoform X1, partial [Tanacetum coccineum]
TKKRHEEANDRRRSGTVGNFSLVTFTACLVVSTCLGGAFIGSLFSGWTADEFRRRKNFQLCALPMVIGAAYSATTRTLTGMLIGRFIVRIRLGIGSPVATLYITEVK